MPKKLSRYGKTMKPSRYISMKRLERAGIKVIGHGRKCWFKGKSGANYQIDVLTVQQDGEKSSVRQSNVSAYKIKLPMIP